MAPDAPKTTFPVLMISGNATKAPDADDDIDIRDGVDSCGDNECGIAMSGRGGGGDNNNDQEAGV